MIHALELLAGNTDGRGLPCAYACKEGLEALGSQLVESLVFAYLHARSKLDAHFADDVYLGFDNIFCKSVRGNAEGEHAAQLVFLLEDGYGIAPESEIVGAAQSGGAGSDDGYFFLEGFACHVLHLGDGACLRVELSFGKELLHLVDGDGSVDIASGALFLAETRADSSADCGEGVFLTNQLESLVVAALGCKLEIALNGNVGGAVGLAGSRAVLGDDGALFSVVRAEVPARPPESVVGSFLRNGEAGNFAELLAELEGVDLTVFNTLSAGNALVFVDIGLVVGPYRVGSLEVLGYAETEAGAAAAVADCRESSRFGVEVRDLVNKAVLLATP